MLLDKITFGRWNMHKRHKNKMFLTQVV